MTAAAFLLVVDKRPGSAPPRSFETLDRVTDLGFEPQHRLRWSDASGGVRLWCWSDHPGSWEERGGDVAVVTGDLRRRGSPGTVSSGVGALGDCADVERARRDLRGVYAAAVLTAGGDGLIVTDPIGHRCLYHGEDDDVLVISSRASLAAHALTSAGTRPPRDRFGACWLPFTTYRVGERSGFEGVHVLRPGTTLRLAGGRARWARADPFEVALDDPQRSSSIEERAALVLDDVADALRSLLAQPAERHVLSLTGGKDSRLVLAAALRAGLAHDLVYETVGPPELVDVQIATELADEFGLRHEVRFLELQHREPFGERFRQFVDLTGGMVSGWDLQGSTYSGDLHLTGICGELLRSCQKLPDAVGSPGRLAETFAIGRVGRLGLLQPPLAEKLHTELLDRLASEPRPDADPLDRAQAHYASSRMRFTRLGPREELPGDRRIHPLYSPLGMRAALSLDPADRNSEVLVGWMLRLASDRLVRHRFTDPGWDARASRSLGLAPADTQASEVAASATSKHPTPLMASLAGGSSDGRASLLAEVFADAGNPAWDLLDRQAALDGLARYGQLRTHERQELFGAATAAVWLAG